MKIIDREFFMLGNKVHIRIEPKSFVRLMNKLNKLVTNQQLSKAKSLFEGAYRTWGMDPELIRVNTLINFLTEEDLPEAPIVE